MKIEVSKLPIKIEFDNLTDVDIIEISYIDKPEESENSYKKSNAFKIADRERRIKIKQLSERGIRKREHLDDIMLRSNR